MTTRLDIPNPGAPNFEQRVREALMTYLGRQGSPLDRGLTLRDLIDAGLLEIPAGFTLRPGGVLPLQPGPAINAPGPGTGTTPPPVDTTPPPAPTGFTAASAVAAFIVQCATPTYTQGGGHLRSRLYGVTYSGGPEPVFADAVELAQFGGILYAHPSNPATTWRLWLRWESRAGILGPVAGGTTGLSVTTAQDVSTLIEALTGEITLGQLATSLASRIDLIDGPSATPGTVNARIQAEVDARVAAVSFLQGQIDALVDLQSGDLTGLINQINAVNAALLAEVDARTIANAALAAATERIGQTAQELVSGLSAEQVVRASQGAVTNARVEGIGAQSGANAAAIRAEEVVRATDTSALASQTSTLAVGVGAARAAVQAEQVARVTADEAVAAQATTLLAASAAASAAILVEQEVRANADSVSAAQAATLAVAIGSNAAGVEVERVVRAEADGAAAAQLVTLSAAAGNASAAIRTEQEVRATEDSSLASQVTGLAAGFGANIAGVRVEQQAQASATAALVTQTQALGAVVGANTGALQVEQTVRASADSVVASEVVSLAGVVGQAVTGLEVERIVRASEGASLAAQTTTLVSAVGGVGAGLQVEQETRSTADAAAASQLVTLAAEAGAGRAALFAEQVVRAGADTAAAAVAAGLTAVTANTSAGLLTEQQVRSTADAATATRLDSVTAVTNTTAAALQSEQTARADADSANAGAITVLQVAVNGNTAAISTESTVRATAVGAIEAKNTVKVDVAGHVAGYGLIATANNAAPTSQFGVRADQFFVAPAATVATTAPGSPYRGQVWVDSSVTPNVTRYWSGSAWTTTPQALPFIIQNVPTTINGVSVPAGVYIDTAYIRNGTITTALIGDATITNAKVVDLNVVKLTGGSMQVGSFIQSTNYTSGPGGAGWRINADGTAELQAAYIRGLLQASQINVPGTWINSNITVNASGQLVGIGTENIQVDNSRLSLGQNRFYGSDQAQTVRFFVGYNPNNADLEAGQVRFAASSGLPAEDVMQLGNLRNVYLRQIGRHAGTTDLSNDGFGNTVAVDVNGVQAAVVPGERICGSVYLHMRRCRANAFLEFTRGDGSLSAIDPFPFGPVVSSPSPLPANTLANYTRAQIIAVAPADAARVRLLVRKYNTFDGQSDSVIWLAAPQIEVIGASASGPSPYQSGPIQALSDAGYTGDLNATLGAPSGTPVGGTTADIVAATVAAVNDSVSGLNSRLRSNAASILTGPVTIQTGGAIQAVSGANSVTITPTGIVGIIGGAARFTLNAWTGEAVFGGTLNAATGSFVGSVSVNGRTWTSGSGFFAGIDSGVPRLVIGTADQYLSFDGATGKLEIKLAGAVANPGPFFASGYSISPNNSIARVRINRNGQVVAGGGASNATITLTAQGNWYIPNETAIGDLYDVRYDLVSGSGVSASALGAWQQLNADRLVELVRNGGSLGFSDAVVQYSIRLRSTNAVVATGNIYLSVTVDA